MGFRNNNVFYRAGLLVQRPTPNLEDQASVFMTPGDRVTQLYPQALGTHCSRLLRHAWVTVGLYLIPATTREAKTILVLSIREYPFWTRPVILAAVTCLH
jgi:hypothetical protein